MATETRNEEHEHEEHHEHHGHCEEHDHHKHWHRHGAPALGPLWLIGWLFTIGYVHLTFWQSVLGIVIWPFYLGRILH